MEKQFLIHKNDIKDLVPNLGAGVASDQIMVDGSKIRFMCRDEPHNELDSGWSFFSGEETDEYLEDPENTSIFTLNTISNYAPEIIPFLTYPIGTEIQRNQNGELVITEGESTPPDVVFLPPIEAGFSSISKYWNIKIPYNMYRRIEHDSVVFWTKDITIWLHEIPSNSLSIEENTSRLLEKISPKSSEIKTRSEEAFRVISYLLTEQHEGNPQHSITIFGISEINQMLLTVYYENEADLDSLKEMSLSMKPVSV